MGTSRAQSIFHNFIILQVVPMTSSFRPGSVLFPLSSAFSSATFFALHCFPEMDSILPLDVHWLGRPRSIAAALLRSNDFCALVDPGPTSTLDNLRAQLAIHDCPVSTLQAIFLTHIHLDHAGATGSLLLENPDLRVYVHSRGAVHMADPTPLLASAGRLYGDKMQHLFGEFLPVPQRNLHVLEGGETLSFGSRELQVLYTPGHAHHHVTYFDPSERVAFVGDTTGICIEGQSFLLPATPPPDIQLELWDASLDAIEKLQPRRLFLTHFGFSDQVSRHLSSYHQCLSHWSELTAQILASGLDDAQAMETFVRQVTAEAATTLSPNEISEYSSVGAPRLSWLGLARYHRKRMAA
jgi:glyoxylase-like metal-dependent hydrolase (beta-lactamase superfamily II)